jgi:hypothetical protein
VREYCRAYHLADLRGFPGWGDLARPQEKALSGDTIVYLWDDLSVVVNPVVAADEGILWDAATAQWESFCVDSLKFEIPEDLRHGED